MFNVSGFSGTLRMTQYSTFSQIKKKLKMLKKKVLSIQGVLKVEPFILRVCRTSKNKSLLHNNEDITN